MVQAAVPDGIAPGQSFKVHYTPVASTMTNNATNSATNYANTIAQGYRGFASSLISKASEVTVAKTGKSPEEWMNKVQEKVTKSTAEWRSKLSSQIDHALSSCDDSRLNQLLDSAVAGHVLRSENVPNAVRRAANHVATRQLKAAMASETPKQLKGALVAAKRLHATEVPEYEAALAKYKEVKKLPPGFDLAKMMAHRKGNKMVAKQDLSEEAVRAKFQRLLDLTHRKVYTRDRQGQPVPDGLELVSVSAVTNDDLWADYISKRETIRQELAEDPEGFQEYVVDTVATAAPPAKEEAPKAEDAAEAAEATTEGKVAEGEPTVATTDGETAEAISAALAGDFAEPLLKEVNEVFLFHGTSAAAANKIATANYNINLAGSSAGTLYGRGIYLAENATKSDEYTRPLVNGERHLIVCRVALGRVYYSDDKATKPRECEEACLRGRHHSVLGDRKKCRGTFREFVVFDEEQVYPNYILTYRRAGGVVDSKHQLDVVCPLGTKPGATLQVKTPDGTVIHVLVPAGTTPGQKFTVQY